MPASIDKSTIGLALGLLGALALYAAFPPASKATEVTPASTSVTFSLAPNTTADFHWTNAYASTWLECDSSEFSFTTPSDASPPDNNKNQPGVGTHSDDHGSVGVPLDQNPNDAENDRVVTLRSCTLQHETFGAIDTATITTNDDHGAWSISAHASDSRDPLIAIGTPKDMAAIVMAENDCTITFSHHPDGYGVASAVMGEYDPPPAGDNGNGQARVDAQMAVTQVGADCNGESPAQFEATYEPDVAVSVDP